jgi:hypothetical protein
MIPQRTGGTAPRIVAFENGEDEGKRRYDWKKVTDMFYSILLKALSTHTCSEFPRQTYPKEFILW